jgi:hypothetical protein
VAPEPIPSITKYTSRGSTKHYWVPTIEDPAAPTRIELDAGTDLSPQLADATGWSVSSTTIPTPDEATRYTSTIPGVIEAEASTLVMYMSRDGVDARALMPRDEEGFIVVMDGGDVDGNLCDVFPVTVTSVSKMRSVNGSEADRLTFTYAITDEPSEDVTVPSAA